MYTATMVRVFCRAPQWWEQRHPTQQEEETQDRAALEQLPTAYSFPTIEKIYIKSDIRKFENYKSAGSDGTLQSYLKPELKSSSTAFTN